MKFKLIYEDDYLNEDGCCADLSIALIDGDIICSNCGCILGKNFVEEQKRAYSFEEINERIQHSPRWREFGPRTIIPNTNLDSKGQSLEPQGKRLFTRLSKIQNSLISSIERNFWESKPKLNLFASKAGSIILRFRDFSFAFSYENDGLPVISVLVKGNGNAIEMSRYREDLKTLDLEITD